MSERGRTVAMAIPMLAIALLVWRPAVHAAAGDGAEWREPVRGRVLDGRSGQGLPRIEIRIRRPDGTDERVISDDTGAFESEERYAAKRFVLRAWDAITGEFLGMENHHHGPSEDGSPREASWKLDVGPTIRLAVEGAGPEEGWQGRIRETNGADEDVVWSWRELVRDEPTGAFWLRYTELEHEPSAQRTPVLEVTNAARTESGTALLRTTVGVHPGVVEVSPAPTADTVQPAAPDANGERAAIEGRVVDVDGRPVSAQVVSFGPDRPSESTLRGTSTNREGRFRLAGLAPGRHRFRVFAEHRPVTRFELELEAGQRAVHDLVVSAVSAVGDVKGALVGPASDTAPLAYVRLESLSGGIDRVETVGADRGAGGRSAFAFEDLPAGSYRLTPTSLDGRSYEPAFLDVSPPYEGAVFTTQDAARGEDGPGVEWFVRDATSARRLPGFYELMRIGPLWLSEVVFRGPWDLDDVRPFAPLPLHFVVSAPGYLPASFEQAAARASQDGGLLPIDLEPGWGAALVLFDADRILTGPEVSFEDYGLLPWPGLSGVRVLVDGRPVGTSDASGLALLTFDGPIEAGDLRLDGWSILLVEPFRGHATTAGNLGFLYASRE